MEDKVQLRSAFTVMAFVCSENNSNSVQQVGIASVADGKIETDLYFEDGDAEERIPSFIDEWSSLEFILKEEQVVVSSKKGLQAFRSTLSKHKIAMPIVPQLIEASELVLEKDIDQITSMTTDARLIASLLASKMMVGTKTSKSGDNILNTNPFYGKKYVITGKVWRYEREDIEYVLQLLGAEQRKEVNSLTNYILTGDNPGWAKLKKAKDFYDNGNDIIRISYEQVQHIMHISKPFIEKKAFNRNVDEQAFVNSLKDIVSQEREKADFSTNAYNYAAAEIEELSSRQMNWLESSNDDSCFPSNTISEANTSVEIKREDAQSFQTYDDESASYLRWLKYRDEENAAHAAKRKADEERIAAEKAARQATKKQNKERTPSCIKEPFRNEQRQKNKYEPYLMSRKQKEDEHKRRLAEERKRKEQEEREAERHRVPEWAKILGYIVAASVALALIWNTGLLIPLGLIGLATSGILKWK